MRINADQARQYFWHPSQRVGTATVDMMTDDGFAYYAESGVCLAFNDVPWPGVIMCHVGAMPGAWGRAVEPAKRMLAQAWSEYGPERIVFWIPEQNRAAIAFAKRCGGEMDGRMNMGNPITMMGWTPWQF